MPYKSREQRIEYNRKWNRQHYLKNTAAEKARTSARRNMLKKYIQSLKQNKQCFFCTENEPVCLDFHHKNAKEKSFSLANAYVDGLAISKIDCEVKKCVLLCANCHRKVHTGKLTIK